MGDFLPQRFGVKIPKIFKSCHHQDNKGLKIRRVYPLWYIFGYMSYYIRGYCYRHYWYGWMDGSKRIRLAPPCPPWCSWPAHDSDGGYPHLAIFQGRNLSILEVTLPKTNSSHLKIRPFQKKSSLPIINFQGRAVSFREWRKEESFMEPIKILLMSHC